ncbi:hypothetical protein [Dickeya solani]|uniref:Uncharacterized protein n=1 Tax=Dickeya solani TaxID=1089444 RepID=A0ABU4EAT8_9GAMM|nr:hypothetical protein [Dickeya solani]MCZ0819681.1 hypothetical protein [Dickeya solani]MDV6993408.1 hypothetical protein [Dickeya solani]MDV7003514.1 hypothetical protein [Dickeya solani]MDV7036257.1 hypothetical protein [Dickeya solani]MDV7041129.1 hypothetical protein [Dickeya solani]
MDKAQKLELAVAELNAENTEAENEILLDVTCMVSNKEWQE